MAHPSSTLSLRNVLVTDAFTCLACGFLMSLASGPLAELTLIPANLLRYAGLSLFPVAAFIAFVAARAVRSAPAVWLVIAGNALWIGGSLFLALGAMVAPTALGVAFILGQAAVVAALTGLEISGARGLGGTSSALAA